MQRLTWVIVLWMSGAVGTLDAQNVSDYHAIAEPLLFLLREPAVHEHLALTAKQRGRLIKFNQQHDAKLLSSRNKPPSESQAQVNDVIQASRAEIATLFDRSQQQTLRQIVYRLKGIAFVLEPDASSELDLTASQQQQIRRIVETARGKLRTLRQQLSEESIAASQAKQQSAVVQLDEQKQVLKLLDSNQQQRLLGMIGREFDLRQLGHVALKAPEIEGAETWINSPPLKLAELRGNVVAVHFWAFGCINCIRNYPWYKDWHTAFADQGLVIVGVHTPETSAEREVDGVRKKVKEAGFDFPIVVDNNKSIWDGWGNAIWPSVYLIDKRGQIRYWWYGELDWQGAGGQRTMGKRIAELLAEPELEAAVN